MRIKLLNIFVDVKQKKKLHLLFSQVLIDLSENLVVLHFQWYRCCPEININVIIYYQMYEKYSLKGIKSK